MRKKEVIYTAIIIFTGIIIWKPIIIRIIMGIIFSLLSVLSGIILIPYAFSSFTGNNLAPRSFIARLVCFMYGFLLGLGMFILAITVIAFILNLKIGKILSILLDILFGSASLIALMALIIEALIPFIKKCFKRK